MRPQLRAQPPLETIRAYLSFPYPHSTDPQTRHAPRYPQGMPHDKKSDEQKTSHALDSVIVFEGSGTTAEIEALGIQAVLEAEGIRVVLGGETSFPSLPWTVGVSKADAPRALEVIAEAKKAGPKAAAEAEAEQERSQN
jgi:hypothetical protein